MRKLSKIEALLLQAGATCLSGEGARRALQILVFHRVLPEPDELQPGEPDATRFAAIVDMLASGFRVLGLRDAVRQLRSGTLPRRAVAITFDDGYANNCELAMPILRARGLTATVFVATGYLNGGAMFSDIVVEAVRSAPARVDLGSLGLGVLDLPDALSRRNAIKVLLETVKYWPAAERQGRVRELARLCGQAADPDLMMTDAQVVKLHQSRIEVGAHTVSHPILANLEMPEVRDELMTSRRHLERLIGAPVTSFAYPNGRPGRDYRAVHAGVVRELGFELAVTTARGVATRATDPFQLPRMAMWGAGPMEYGLRVASAFRSRDVALAS